ncbi:putative methyltransferase-like protein 25 [Clavelina lepadiformis]|uniref:putative methyltransferase-like protein 25 n=1 Tax=Clavelina lepadiformis TaxID=159417 RepID=UPI0040419BE2
MGKDAESLYSSMTHIQQYITKYGELGNAHMVEYFTKDHWNNLLPQDLRTDLMKLSVDQLYTLPLELSCSNVKNFEKDPKATVSIGKTLLSFIQESKVCHLGAQDILTNINDLKSALNYTRTGQMDKQLANVKSKEYMCQKKAHEITEMSPVIDALCCHCNTSKVLDVGSGRGYLSTFLSLRYQLDVTAVDCTENNTISASLRAEKFFKYWNKRLSGKKNISQASVTEVTTSQRPSAAVPSFKSAYVSCDTELVDLQPSDTDITHGCVIVGLHTCGDLASTITELFVKHSFIKGLCVVGCCYHHLTEKYDQTEHERVGFPLSSYLKNQHVHLGRNIRMVGLKAPEKVAVSDIAQMSNSSERSLFYRAILTVILQEEFLMDISRKDICIGKVFSKSKSFIDYVQRSVKKLNLNCDKLSDERIMDYLHKFQPRFKEIIAFAMMRQFLAPAIEALIVLDKLCYLLESAESFNISQCHVSEIFNPIKSPRRYAIVAFKS